MEEKGEASQQCLTFVGNLRDHDVETGVVILIEEVRQSPIVWYQHMDQ